MTGDPPSFLLEEGHPLAERVALLERDLVVVRRVLGIRRAQEREDDQEDEPDTGAPVDHGAPKLDLRHPAAWRGLPGHEVAVRWKDLCAWIDWLIVAYRLPPRQWEAWWECPGAGEELWALRTWHRELVDRPVAELRHPPDGLDPDEEIGWQSNQRTARLDLARSHVEWHEALWQLVARVAGVNAEQKPLLTREAESTDRSRQLRDEERARRSETFAQWLTQPSGSDDGAAKCDRPGDA